MNDLNSIVPQQINPVNPKRQAKSFEDVKGGFFFRISKIPMGYESRCWIWNGKPNSVGYGIISWGGRNGKRMYAHRFSWMKYKGQIPDGLWVLHKCDIRNCVNPRHLFLGTAQDNTDDMFKKGRNRAPRGEACGKSKVSEDQVLEIRKMSLSGNSISSISKLFGLSYNAIDYIIHGESWRHSGGPLKKRQQKWKMTKLSNDKICEINKLLNSGMTQASVAIRFGVNQSHVSRLRRGIVCKPRETNGLLVVLPSPWKPSQ